MAELKDIDVDRIDGVEDPATKKRFLILKAEEPDELRANVEALLKKVQHALGLLAKSADLQIDEECAKALDELAEELGIEPVFAAKAKKKPEEEYGYGYGYPPEKKKPAKKAEDDEVIISKLAELLDRKFEELTQALKPAEPPAGIAKSRQPAVQDATGTPRKLGEGLFANVIFGREG